MFSHGSSDCNLLVRSRSEQSHALTSIQYLARGHLDTRTAGERDQTTALPITGRPLFLFSHISYSKETGREWTETLFILVYLSLPHPFLQLQVAHSKTPEYLHGNCQKKQQLAIEACHAIATEIQQFQLMFQRKTSIWNLPFRDWPREKLSAF